MWLSLLLSLSAGVLLWLGGFFADSKGRRRLLAVVLPVIGFTLTLAHEYLDATADNVAAVRAAESDAALNREITDMGRQLTARADSDAALNREITATTRALASALGSLRSQTPHSTARSRSS